MADLGEFAGLVPDPQKVSAGKLGSTAPVAAAPSPPAGVAPTTSGSPPQSPTAVGPDLGEFAKLVPARNPFGNYEESQSTEQDEAAALGTPMAREFAKIGLGVMTAPLLGAGLEALQAIRPAAIIARQQAVLQAERDAAHIKAVAEAVKPGTWNEAGASGQTVGQRVTQFLKQDADATATARAHGPEFQTPAETGGPQWTSQPGRLPAPPADATAADTALGQAQAKAAADAAARTAAKSLLKDPRVLTLLLGGAGMAAGQGLWGAMRGSYHAARTIQYLSRIFGE